MVERYNGRMAEWLHRRMVMWLQRFAPPLWLQRFVLLQGGRGKSTQPEEQTVHLGEEQIILRRVEW